MSFVTSNERGLMEIKKKKIFNVIKMIYKNKYYKY